MCTSPEAVTIVCGAPGASTSEFVDPESHRSVTEDVPVTVAISEHDMEIPLKNTASVSVEVGPAIVIGPVVPQA